VLPPKPAALLLDVSLAGIDEQPSGELIVFDEAPRDASRQGMLVLLRGVAADETAEKNQRLQAEQSMLEKAITEANIKTIPIAELDALQARIERLGDMGSPGGPLFGLELNIFYAYSAHGVDAFEVLLKRLVTSPHEMIRNSAVAASAVLQKRRANLDQIKFTAVDGREVSLPALRGKTHVRVMLHPSLCSFRDSRVIVGGPAGRLYHGRTVPWSGDR